MAVIHTVVPSFIHVELLLVGVFGHGLGFLRHGVAILLVPVEILFLLHLCDHPVVVLLRPGDPGPGAPGTLGRELSEDQLLRELLEAGPQPGEDRNSAA